MPTPWYESCGYCDYAPEEFVIIAVWCTHKLEVALILSYTILIFQTAPPICLRTMLIFGWAKNLIRP